MLHLKYRNMFSTKDGIPICIVKGGKSDGEIVFLDDGAVPNYKTKLLSSSITAPKVVSVEDGKFQQLPSDKVRVLYIAGPSGAGKSTYISEYAKIYKKLYPGSRIILFSRIADDPAFDDLCYKQIELTDDLVENPLQLEEVIPGSLVIFDDIDTVSNKKLLKSLLNFQSQVLELGRHKDIKCLITSHLINKGPQTKTIMNEMQSFTFFPQSGAARQIRYALEQYVGMKYKEITKMMKTNSRWITILRNYPQILLSEHKCMFLSELDS